MPEKIRNTRSFLQEKKCNTVFERRGGNYGAYKKEVAGDMEGL